jgi:hypothetical protein
MAQYMAVIYTKLITFVSPGCRHRILGAALWLATLNSGDDGPLPEREMVPVMCLIALP